MKKGENFFSIFTSFIIYTYYLGVLTDACDCFFYFLVANMSNVLYQQNVWYKKKIISERNYKCSIKKKCCVYREIFSLKSTQRANKRQTFFLFTYFHPFQIGVNIYAYVFVLEKKYIYMYIEGYNTISII
jgi:hypothetical protein